MITDSEIINAVNETDSMGEASRRLDMPFNTFKRRAQKLGVYNPSKPKRKERKICKRCNSKELLLTNITGYCQQCYYDSENDKKISLWLKTGDTSNFIGGSIRNVIRDYIYIIHKMEDAIYAIWKQNGMVNL